MNQKPDIPKTIVYSFVVADLFHYGHLQLLKTAHSLGDYHICGVLTDEAAVTYRPRPVSNLDERIAVLSQIKCIDRVVIQDSKDPTHNLRKIHSEFSDSKLVLVHGNDWDHIPGKEFIKQINGEIVQPEYYRRLSDKQIRSAVLGQLRTKPEYNYEMYTEHFNINSIEYYASEQKNFVLSSKANTLKSLQKVVSKSIIEKMFVFRVCDWEEDSEKITDKIKTLFSPCNIIVRSSAVNEDTYYSSSAGSFLSRMNVSSEDTRIIREAIKEVIDSYNKKGGTFRLDQILVQKQTMNVKCSGVVFTANIENGAPYYIINYDDVSGSTESVTSGLEGRVIELFNQCEMQRIPDKWKGLISAIKELETIIPRTYLDIEFAVTSSDEVIIFQVRPLVIRTNSSKDPFEKVSAGMANNLNKYKRLSDQNRNCSSLPGVFSDMAFWNPAEIIGDRPNLLDYSIYRYIITDRIWNDALIPLGYSTVTPSQLMIHFSGKPYIDVRKAFQALMPGKLPTALKNKLADYYLDKLVQSPESHDKVEFEIIDNCFDFCLEDRFSRMVQYGFQQNEIDLFSAGLIDLTNDIFADADQIINNDMAAVKAMEKAREKIIAQGRSQKLDYQACISLSKCLIEDCKRLGTLPFSRMARMAFIGNQILVSMVEKKYITKNFYDQFMDSIHTVASQLSHDYASCSDNGRGRDLFLKKYGHLRPGTYNIMSPRYDRSDDFFMASGYSTRQNTKDQSTPFTVTKQLHDLIDAELLKGKIQIDSRQLFRFIKKTTEAREFIKFEFSKNLSAAIEFIALSGKKLGFSRSKMGLLSLKSILYAGKKDPAFVKQYWNNVGSAFSNQKQMFSLISLPPVIHSADDFKLIVHPDARPNYITGKNVTGRVANLALGENVSADLFDKIVFIENADPGYDWIFTKNIKGLITKYGGVASHMAIRCAEFGIPAAIGCGETLSNRVKKANKVNLNCSEKSIRTIE